MVSRGVLSLTGMTLQSSYCHVGCQLLVSDRMFLCIWRTFIFLTRAKILKAEMVVEFHYILFNDLIWLALNCWFNMSILIDVVIPNIFEFPIRIYLIILIKSVLNDCDLLFFKSQCIHFLNVLWEFFFLSVVIHL